MSKFHRQETLQGIQPQPQGELLRQFPETYYLNEALKPNTQDRRKKRKKKKKSSKSKY